MPEGFGYLHVVALNLCVGVGVGPVPTRLVEAGQGLLVDAGRAHKLRGRLFLLAQHLVDTGDARIDSFLKQDQPGYFRNTPEIFRHWISAKYAERMVALKCGIGLPRLRVVGKGAGDLILSAQQNVVADDLECSPIATLVIPDPQLIHFQHRRFNRRINVGFGLGHPVYDASALVREPSATSLERIEATGDDVHGGTRRIPHTAGQTLHVRLGALFQIGFVGAPFDQVAKLRRRNQHAVRERFHVGVKSAMIFMQHAKVFRLHQLVRELFVDDVCFNESKAFAQRNTNRLRDQIVGVGLATIFANAGRSDTALRLVDDIGQVRVGDGETQRHRREQQRLKVIQRRMGLVKHCRSGSIRRPSGRVRLEKRAAILPRRARRHTNIC